jgi:hypothetical protein
VSSPCPPNVRQEIEIEIEIEKELEIELDKEIDKELSKESSTSANADYPAIKEMYNFICVSYPRVNQLSDSRKKAIKARLGSYSVDDFKTLFEKAESSHFLKGGNNRNWKANFDWLIKDANMAKVLDGNYDNEKDTPQGPDPKAPNEKTRAAVDWLEDFMTGGGA